MKKQPKDLQCTIRGVPPEVDHILRCRAAHRKQSLSQVVVDELTTATTGPRKRVDLSDVACKWTPDPEFDEILAAQRQIDLEKWKCEEHDRA